MQSENILVNLPNVLIWKSINNVYSSRKKTILRLFNAFLYSHLLDTKLMGAKDSPGQEYEMYLTPNIIQYWWKCQKTIEQCYKSMIFFFLKKCTIKPEPHSRV